MAINVPMPDLPGNSLMKGVDTGSSLWSRIMQPAIERERMQQQQQQFLQNLALQKQAQGRAQQLLPLMIQQYQDAHRTAQSEAQFKEMYRNLIRDAVSPDAGTQPAPNTPLMSPQAGAQADAMLGGQPGMGQPANVAPPVPGASGMAPNSPNMPAAAPPAPAIPGNMMPNMATTQERELRPGNPRLSKLDQIAGLVPGIPKPTQHIQNGMVFTTYPSGRMTVQQVQGQAGQTQGERNVSAKEASKIRDQATALINSANLVNQGYELLDNNDDLTGIGSGIVSGLNLSSNPELGKFTSVTGKLQAELGKYAASRGGIQAVKWAGSVKPSTWKPEDYNYGMFEGIERNLKDDYATLNAQYKAATGEDLPVPLPQVTRKSKGKVGSGESSTGDKKVKKVWKLVNGELV